MNGTGVNGSPAVNTAQARVEIVTTTFVASGVPAGIRDMGRLLENLNNPAISRQVELRDASLRPLYRAASPLLLETPVLVRRDDIIFATFEGPYVEHDVVRPSASEAPCLLMAPPFQIQGAVSLGAGAEAQESLRALITGFLAVSNARVYDADGYLLGEGERIVVNGTRVQMSALTKRHIEAFAEHAGTERRATSLADLFEDDVATELVTEARAA